jgi:hypothetical protein
MSQSVRSDAHNDLAALEGRTGKHLVRDISFF